MASSSPVIVDGSIGYTEPIDQKRGILKVSGHVMHGVDVVDVENCFGLENCHYEKNVVSLIREPIESIPFRDGKDAFKGRSHGDVVFIPANAPMSYKVHQPYDKTLISIQDQTFAVATKDLVDIDDIDFSVSCVTSTATWNFGKALSDLGRNEEYRDWPMLIESASLALAVAIVKEFTPNGSSVFKRVPYRLSEVRRGRVVEYINSNIHRQISVSELAGVANLSVFHFTRKFTNHFGMTPVQYIARRRVHAAKRMMMTTGEPLSAIAYACGFASQSHFSTVFKKVAGTTPAAYRNSRA